MLLFSTIAAAACPASVEAFSTRLTAAEDAFSSMMLEPFRVELAAIEAEIGCLEEKLEPLVVARLHRVRAMGAFLERDQPGAVAAFQGQRAADPELDLPEKYVEQHPLRKLYVQAGETEDPRAPLEQVEGVQIWVDGHQATERPTARVALFQLTREQQLLGSQLLPGGASLTVPKVAPAPAPAAVPPSDPSPTRAKRVPIASIGLGVAAGVAAGSAIGLYASGRSAKARYDDPTTPFEDLDALRTKTNTRHFGAQILGASAVGLGAVAVISGVL